ncbi:MAG: hypothetical protein E7592_03155 [Ruminococcaceae bacterium]|nr:hypothetical protein [Oscillospiraceae bacterium]
MSEKKNLKQEKSSVNYFKKSDTLQYVGGGLLIVSLISLWLGWGMISYILAIIGTPTGLILFLVGASGKVSDQDMDNYIENKMADLKIDIDNDRSYQTKLLKHLKEYTAEGYLFHDSVMIKKRKDNSLRSSEFSRAKIRILSDRLYIVHRQISLISDEVTSNKYEINYDSISSVRLERDSKRMILNKNTFITKPCCLRITFGETEIFLPIADAITSDELVDVINRQISVYKEKK